MNSHDAMSSSLTLVFSLLIVVIPLWGYFGIKRNFGNLNRYSVMSKYGIFYSSNRVDTH